MEVGVCDLSAEVINILESMHGVLRVQRVETSLLKRVDVGHSKGMCCPYLEWRSGGGGRVMVVGGLVVVGWIGGGEMNWWRWGGLVVGWSGGRVDWWMEEWWARGRLD